MPRITKYSRYQTTPRENFFSNLWNWFLSLDKFIRFFIITGVVIIICVPAIVAEQTGFFSHAGSSLFTTCVQPPSGFNQQELQMLAQSRKVNWCPSLAQNINIQDNTMQSSGNQIDSTSSSGVGFLSGIMGGIQQFLLAVRLLFLGR